MLYLYVCVYIYTHVYTHDIFDICCMADGFQPKFAHPFAGQRGHSDLRALRERGAGDVGAWGLSTA